MTDVRIVEGDGTVGFAEEAPFDAILAAASGSHVPHELLAQLKPGGRLVMPLGEPGSIQNSGQGDAPRRRNGRAGGIGGGAICAADRRPWL